MSAQFGFVILTPLLLSLLLTPWVIRLAEKTGAIDMPDERKVHQRPMPRLGGVSICLSFFLSLGLAGWMFQDLPLAMTISSSKGLIFGGALLLMLGIGVWDDHRPMPPGRKCLMQLAVATLVYLAGFRISSITHPLGAGLLDIGILDYPVTILWIVGVTNAFNLIDGLDGLASGVGVIASLTIFTIAMMHGDLTAAVLALTLAGALLGFLRYNFNPARIFLGDSGSLFIGFTLALLALQSSAKGSTAFALLVPVLALGLPIIDTLVAMSRRFLRSLLPEYRIGSWLHQLHAMFLPDRSHIHHRLISLGLSHRKVVLVMYLASGIFGIGACAMADASAVDASLILAALAVATLAGIRRLDYREMAIMQNGVLLPLYKLPLLNRGVFQGFCDLIFAGFAFYAACLLTGAGDLPGTDYHRFYSLITVVCGIQLTVMYATGLYQGTIRLMGIGDLLKTVKSVTLAGIVGSVMMYLFPIHDVPWITFVVDYYFLLSLVAGSRVSFHALNYFFLRRSKRGKGVLIYGADAGGVLLLQHLLNDPMFDYRPIGFLDDTPDLEGKKINGFPVFGGHWRLERLAHRYPIECILLSDERIKPEILFRLTQIAGQHHITVKHPTMHLEDVAVMPSAVEYPDYSMTVPAQSTRASSNVPQV